MTDAEQLHLVQTLQLIESHHIAIWPSADRTGWIAASQFPEPYRHVHAPTVAEAVRMFVSNAPND